MGLKIRNVYLILKNYKNLGATVGGAGAIRLFDTQKKEVQSRCLVSVARHLLRLYSAGGRQNNSNIHNINIRSMHHLHGPNANLSCFEKKVRSTPSSRFSTVLHVV